MHHLFSCYKRTFRHGLPSLWLLMSWLRVPWSGLCVTNLAINTIVLSLYPLLAKEKYNTLQTTEVKSNPFGLSHNWHGRTDRYIFLQKYFHIWGGKSAAINLLTVTLFLHTSTLGPAIVLSKLYANSMMVFLNDRIPSSHGHDGHAMSNAVTLGSLHFRTVAGSVDTAQEQPGRCDDVRGTSGETAVKDPEQRSYPAWRRELVSMDKCTVSVVLSLSRLRYWRISVQLYPQHRSNHTFVNIFQPNVQPKCRDITKT